VLVIGDGKSDMCVASTADFVFAKGSLAKYCEANTIPHARFDTFAADLSVENQELFHHV